MRKTAAQVEQELRAHFEKKLREVQAWQKAHPDYRLIELEEYLVGVGQELTSAIVEGLLAQKENKQPVKRPVCKGCGQAMEDKGQKGKYLVTQVGEIRVERSYCWCPQCKSGIFPPG